MGKYSKLLKNFSLLTISNFGSKILSFLLVPLYTYALSTEDYGSFDLINTTVSLLVPILTVGIFDSIVRFLLDKKYNDGDVLFIALKHLTLSVVFFIIFVTINYIFKIFSILNTYLLFFSAMFFVNLIYEFFQNVARGYDKLSTISIAGIINTILLVTLNVYFLLILKLGIDGYFLSYIIANLISAIFIMKKNGLKKIDKTNIDKKLEKEMLNYSKPMAFNSIGWWINNVSDRYVVTYLCGIGANGIYSVAYKIPTILTTLQNIFNQAWTISAVQNLEDENRNNYFKNIYLNYNLLMVMSCSLIILLSRYIAKYLYLNEFYIAWKYTPYLLLSVVFGATSGVLGGIFSAMKDTKVISISTIIGAVVNIILNIIFVYFYGPIGAAIATCISYFIIWIIRVNKVKKYVSLNINFKLDISSYLLLLIEVLIQQFIISEKFSNIFSGCCILLIFGINFKQIKNLFNKLLKRKKD